MIVQCARLHIAPFPYFQPLGMATQTLAIFSFINLQVQPDLKPWLVKCHQLQFAYCTVHFLTLRFNLAIGSTCTNDLLQSVVSMLLSLGELMHSMMAAFSLLTHTLVPKTSAIAASQLRIQVIKHKYYCWCPYSYLPMKIFSFPMVQLPHTMRTLLCAFTASSDFSTEKATTSS